MNYILMALEVLISFIFIYIFYKKYKQDGLYIISVIIFILSILLSIKNIEIMNFEIPLAIILPTLILTISNILVQKQGLEAIKKLIYILSIVSVSIVTIILLTSLIIPSDYLYNYNISYYEIIKDNLRTIIITAISPLIIIWINSLMYYQLKREKNNVFISNIFTSLVISFIDATIFSLLVFTYVIPLSEIFMIIAIIYVIKLLINISATLLVYKTKNTIK